MTEIAIVITNGVEIIDEYSTLLKPDRHIPYNIQTLTGISNEMVEDAPLVEEVFHRIEELLTDRVFVAHNVNFDYSFVKHAYNFMGKNYNPNRLCTVRYTRKLIPGLSSYSLSNLCSHFNYKNAAAHRAWGDAIATALILHDLLKIDKDNLWRDIIKRNSGELNLPANLPSEEFKNLPESCGVYYFYNKAGKPIYIGKAKNIKKRVSTHFIGKTETKKSQAFKREIYSIDFQLTGSELIAHLLEDHEIRHFWPEYNSAQKSQKKVYGVFAYRNQNANWMMVCNTASKQHSYLAQFYSRHDALNFILDQTKRYSLDANLCSFPTYTESKISAEDHNKSFEKMLLDLKKGFGTFLLKTQGREKGESGFVLIESGKLKGYGFINLEDNISSIEDIEAFLTPLRSSITSSAILRSALSSGKYKMQTLELKLGLLF